MGNILGAKHGIVGITTVRYRGWSADAGMRRE